MHARHLYEYAVIRVVPRVEREEFVNAGVILYCAKQRFLQAEWMMDEARIRILWNAAPLGEIADALQSIQRIAEGGKACGPIGHMDMPSRFRWLTAWRSTMVQTSRVHSGFCDDAAATLERLFAALVA